MASSMAGTQTCPFFSSWASASIVSSCLRYRLSACSWRRSPCVSCCASRRSASSSVVAHKILNGMNGARRTRLLTVYLRLLRCDGLFNLFHWELVTIDEFFNICSTKLFEPWNQCGFFWPQRNQFSARGYETPFGEFGGIIYVRRCGCRIPRICWALRSFWEGWRGRTQRSMSAWWCPAGMIGFIVLHSLETLIMFNNAGTNQPWCSQETYPAGLMIVLEQSASP